MSNNVCVAFLDCRKLWGKVWLILSIYGGLQICLTKNTYSMSCFLFKSLLFQHILSPWNDGFFVCESFLYILSPKYMYVRLFLWWCHYELFPNINITFVLFRVACMSSSCLITTLLVAALFSGLPCLRVLVLDGFMVSFTVYFVHCNIVCHKWRK
jgi:hypothetical protein